MALFTFTSLSPTDFSNLYIHCFVYTVYDDIGGQQSIPGDSGHCLTDNTVTKTDTGGFYTKFDIGLKQYPAQL